MKEQVLLLFRDHASSALVISILLNIIIAVLGVVPSFFISAANLLFFGFWEGCLVSFLGESIGAFVAFVLYRKGFRKKLDHHIGKYPKARQLIEASNREAFILVISLRLIPFVPSGLVTFAASIGRISTLLFFFSSSLGKLPAILLECYSVYQVTRFGWQGKIILALLALGALFFTIKQLNKKRKATTLNPHPKQHRA